MGGPFAAGDFWAALPVTLLAVAVLMLATFAVAATTGRQVVVDVVWGFGFVVVAVTALAVAHASARGWLAAALTAAWGLRLAVHIGLRSRGAGEDPRYEELMAKATGNKHLYALRKVFLTQGVVMWFVSLPVQVAMFETGAPGPVAWLGVVVWAVGLFFEGVGDWQLTRFRNDPASRGKVLDSGLWRYTRHPNYFGDACVWWGLWLLAADAGLPGLLTVLSPVLMTWFLARGTGKPLLEKGMAERRPGYADYVARTSGFFPRPPRRRVT